MASLEDPGEAQVSILSHKASDIASIRHNVCVSSLLKLGCVIRGNGFADRFAAVPVALVVLVAVDESHFDAAVEQIAEFREAIAKDEVASCIEACLSSV